MHAVLFYHSLISDWNHGNAHFLRGVVAELMARGHRVTVYEPRRGWSLTHLLHDHGAAPVRAFRARFPHLRSRFYEPDRLDLDRALADADLVLVHEWNDPALVARLNRRRAAGGRFRLLFHDTHHRCVTAPDEMSVYTLDAFDGVLAFGAALRERYLARGWPSDRVWVWHEAADTRVFHPRPQPRAEGDLIWVGNWGDNERSEALHEFLIEPVQTLALRARVHGVRYPSSARATLVRANIDYRDWLANHEVPDAFARHRVTIHVPRRPYALALPGIPTIRVFEALACGIPLISAPWDDCERLFTPGADFLTAQDGAAMTDHLRRLLADPDEARELAAHGLSTVRARHTCAHRVDELLNLHQRLTTANARERTA